MEGIKGRVMTKEFYAHSVEGKATSEWHTLEDHLKGTAELAASFASEFGCGEWGGLAGLVHRNKIAMKGL